MKTLYTAHATSTAGREGHVETDDKILSFDLSKPGSGAPGTNPEQLFASGYSACFGSAIAAIAKKDGHAPNEIKVQADVSLHQDDKGGYFLSATLNITLDGIDAATAQKIVEKAHHVCPYSKATRGNIEVTLKMGGKELQQAA